jgi:hypothetical protein
MSITLTTPFTVVIGGKQVENDTVGGCTGWSVDAIGGTVTVQLAVGTILDGNLNVGPQAQANQQGVSITVNLTTGAWTSSNGLSGTLTTAQLAAVVAQFLADRNLIEQLAAGNSEVMPGTQVPWTTI